MTEQELREKIARIIAKHLCKNRYSHFQLYGDLANCYSRENFAECEAIADTVDALISEGIGDVSEYKYRAEVAEHELERRLAEATKAMYVYERALYYATLNGETADEVKYNDALKRAQKDFAENKGD